MITSTQWYPHFPYYLSTVCRAKRKFPVMTPEVLYDLPSALLPSPCLQGNAKVIWSLST